MSARRACGIAAALLAASLLLPSAARARPPAEVVVLLHGLGRTDRSMQPLESHLEEAGYRVHNLRYPSRQLGPEALVERLHQQLEACCADSERVHFVTHSLGGIMVRAYAAKHSSERLGRVVMLAPPNQGSAYVDAMEEWDVFIRAVGPTGTQLGTVEDSLPNRLPEPDFVFGVIAGTKNRIPVSRWVIAQPSDGTVSVTSTHLEGMADFITVDTTHTFMPYSPEVAWETLVFLRTGKFGHRGPRPR